MIKVFITGESGTIPMAIQRQALKFDIRIVNNQLEDNFYTKYKNHQSFKVRKQELDFLDKKLLNEVFSLAQGTDNECDIIIHSGAFVGTDFCSSNSALAIKTNIEGTQNIVDICNKFKKQLVYFSTTAILDPKDYNKDKLITEETKINPQTLYGITKYAGELMVKNVCKTPYLIVRPVFGFGNYPDDLHSALTKMIYVITKNILKNDAKLTILLDPNITKSYTRVENIANCILNMIKKQNFNNEIFNIGTHAQYAKNWIFLKNIIRNLFVQKNICSIEKFDDIYNNIKFVAEADYLHYHNINNLKILNEYKVFEKDKDFISLEQGINDTINSVIKNIDEKPYWL
jgi:nucleoside-diphosphate-sugar epimerase